MLGEQDPSGAQAQGYDPFVSAELDSHIANMHHGGLFSVARALWDRVTLDL